MKKQDFEVEFKVLGAGNLRISRKPDCHTSDKFGFSFDVEWGKYGYIGGVLSIEEAEILAHHILDAIKNTDLILMKRDFKAREKNQLTNNETKKLINDLTNKVDKLESDLAKEKGKTGFVRTKFPRKKKTSIFNRLITLLKK